MTHTILSRFYGANSRQSVIEAILAQTVVGGNLALAKALAQIAQLRVCKPHARLIRLGSSDNEIFFILMGRFSVEVNNRPIAERRAGQTVGEMALIDPRAKRSANVIALEPSIVAVVSATAFTRLTERHPLLWRNLASELADRLRQRNMLVRQRNCLPRIFIGSSKESLPIAQGILSGISGPLCEAQLWTIDVFRPSDTAIESLERICYETDFGVLVLGPDDKIRSRGKNWAGPRDNVIFELGLLMGALGRKRVFFVVPSGLKIKIPSDLHGVTYLSYRRDGSASLLRRLAPACAEVGKAVELLGAR